jgi:hypothetical protein
LAQFIAQALIGGFFRFSVIMARSVALLVRNALASDTSFSRSARKRRFSATTLSAAAVNLFKRAPALHERNL